MKVKAIGALMAALFFVTNSGALTRTRKRSEPIHVGMVALLAAPQKYDGKVIQTWGFLCITFRYDGNSLFLHKEDVRASLLKNSVMLILTPEQEQKFKKLNLTYVTVEGTMHSKGPDGPDVDSGTITNITHVDGWSPYVPFDEKEPQ